MPKKINTSTADHMVYLEQVFNQHHVKEIESFEFFYTAQCVWEDTMAESVALNLEDDQMIVRTENGHIIRKFGIPDRLLL